MRLVGSMNEVAAGIIGGGPTKPGDLRGTAGSRVGGYYAQLLFNRDVIFGEVVGNTYLQDRNC